MTCGSIRRRAFYALLDIANGSTTGFEDPSIQFRFVTDS